MKKANKEICAKTRCIVSSTPETFQTTANVQSYDLESLIDNFFDIDDLPGIGVAYNNVPLTKSSPSEMNQRRKNWLSAESGTPKRWWMRGKYLWFEVPPDAAEDVDLDVIYIPDDFNADGQEPFNGLGHLQVYDDAISKYLQWRAKAKQKLKDEAMIAKNDYNEYLMWMAKSVRGMKAASIQLRPKSYPTSD